MSNLTVKETLQESHPRKVLTPASEQGVRALFEGLAAMHETSVMGGPAAAGIAITPSIFSLLENYCGDDPRFSRVLSNVFPMQYQDMKKYGIHPGENSYNVVKPQRRSWVKRLLG